MTPPPTRARPRGLGGPFLEVRPQLKRRRSRVPWVFLLYHARGEAPAPEPGLASCERAMPVVRDRGSRDAGARRSG